MATLTSEQLRFLAGPYALAAGFLLADPDGVRADGFTGSYAHDRTSWQTCPDGIGWSEPGEEEGLLKASSWPHHLTWAQVKGYVKTQPRHLRDALRAACDTYDAAYEDWWRKCNEICPATRTPSPEEQHQIDVEFRRVRESLSDLREAIRDAALALLSPTEATA